MPKNGRIIIFDMSNPYQPLDQVLSAAEHYYHWSEKLENDSWQLKDIFVALVYLEAIADKQRILVNSGSTSEYTKELKEVNKRLNTLRMAIAELRDRIGYDEAVKILESMGKSIQFSYRIDSK